MNWGGTKENALSSLLHGELRILPAAREMDEPSWEILEKIGI